MKKVSLYLDDELWQLFRIACLRNKISASQQIGRLLVQFLHEHERNNHETAEAETSP